MAVRPMPVRPALMPWPIAALASVGGKLSSKTISGFTPRGFLIDTARDFASFSVKFPEIWQLPPGIWPLKTAAEIIFPSRRMAICVLPSPLYLLLTLESSSAPSPLNVILMTHPALSRTANALVTSLPLIKTLSWSNNLSGPAGLSLFPRSVDSSNSTIWELRIKSPFSTLCMAVGLFCSCVRYRLRMADFWSCSRIVLIVFSSIVCSFSPPSRWGMSTDRRSFPTGTIDTSLTAEADNLLSRTDFASSWSLLLINFSLFSPPFFLTSFF